MLALLRQARSIATGEARVNPLVNYSPDDRQAIFAPIGRKGSLNNAAQKLLSV
jgi:hypothetical protein